MRPWTLGTYRWAVAGLATVGVADLLAVNLVVGPAWVAAGETPPLPSQAAASAHATPPPPHAAAPSSTLMPARSIVTTAEPVAARTAPPPPTAELPAAASASAPPSPTGSLRTAPAETVAAPKPHEASPPPTTAAGGVTPFAVLTFGTNSAVLTIEARGLLQNIAREMRARHKLHVHLEGHSDNAGSRELNQWLSVERARAARVYLGELGVDISRVQAAGFGSDRPLSGCTEADCPMNRRVEVLFEETP